MTNNITITLDADNLQQTRGYDEDGEPIVVTLEDAVIAEAARQMRARVEADIDKAASLSKIATVANEEIREQVRPTIEKVLDGDVFYRTDSYGYSTGNAKSLREHVVEEAKKLLKTSGQSRSQDRNSIHAYLDKRIKEIIEEELNTELLELRAAVKEQLGGGIREALAQALIPVKKR